MQNELKPCPFCGSKAAIKIISTKYECSAFGTTFKIFCPKCDFGFKRESSFEIRNGYPVTTKDGYAEVIKKWNRRADNATP